MSWIRITETANVPLREGRAVRLGELDIAVFNLGDRFLAIDNRCPHRDGPLADGILAGDSVVCPLHNWRVGLATGQVTKPADQTALCVRSYPVRVENGILLLNVTQAASKAA